MRRAFLHQDFLTQAVDDGALLIHHVVILQRAFADGEVLLLHFALGALDSVIEPTVLDGFTFLQSKTRHHACEAVAPEEAHEVILKREIEAARPRVALTRTTPAELAVNAPRFVPLGGDHVESARPLLQQSAQRLLLSGGHGVQREALVLNLRFAHPDYAGPKLDIRAAPCHVRGDRNRSCLPCHCHDLRFLRVVLGVQDVVRDARHAEHTAEHFRGVNRHSAQEDRLTAVMRLAHFGDDSPILFALGLIDKVVAVDTADGAVRGDCHHVELIDVVEFCRFRFGGAGHARELRVEPEVVLDGDRGEGLRFALNIHPFLGFDRLMQPFAPTPSGKNASGEFVDNHHLVVLHHVLFVAIIQRIRSEELVNHVQPFALGRKGFLDFPTVRPAFVVREAGVALQSRQLPRQVGHDVHLRVVRRNELHAFIGERDFARLLIDGKEQDLL